MNKKIKLIVERLFNDNEDLLNNDELTLDELSIADNLIYDFVDLGLPSGTLWCTRNVGAKNPEDYGKYFSFNDANEKYYYNLPTKALCYELYNECSWKWTNINYRNGYTVTGKNNNSIFLPAGGCNNIPHGYNPGYGIQGFYWTSSISDSRFKQDKGFALKFSSSEVIPFGELDIGFQILLRQVKKI